MRSEREPVGLSPAATEGPELSEREAFVLRAIVAEHVRTGRPVGSRAVVQQTGLEASTATVRNDMVRLTHMGLIRQPHTSAGRTPTDIGYRHYVDRLMEREQLEIREEAWVKGEFRRIVRETEAALRSSCRLLADLTRCAAVVVAPQETASSFRHVQASSVSATNILLVCVLSDGSVHHQLLEVPEPLQPRQLEAVTRLLNERIGGAAASALSRLDIDGMLRSMGELAVPPEVLRRIREAIELEQTRDTYLEGAVYVLQQPEFESPERLQVVVGALEEQDLVRRVFLRARQSPGVHITIGRENPEQGMWECALVASMFGRSVDNPGVVGVIGPRRLPYARTVSAVAFMARLLSEHLSASADEPE